MQQAKIAVGTRQFLTQIGACVIGRRQVLLDRQGVAVEPGADMASAVARLSEHGLDASAFETEYGDEEAGDLAPTEVAQESA